MRVLVTGATGFVGRWVVRELVTRNCEVSALVRDGSDLTPLSGLPVQLIRAELTDTDQLRVGVAESKPELCIHLAWYVEAGKYLASLRNLEMLQASLRLAEVLADAGCKRLVGVGTNMEYDAARGYVAEDAPTRPASLYGASKLALFHLLEQLAALRGTSFAWGRVFYLYGPYEYPSRLVPDVILSLLRGETAKVTPGEQVRDFLHVEDAARALVDVALSDVTGAVNIASGTPIRLRELVLAIADALDARSRVQLGALPYRANDPMFVCGDVSKLRQATAFTPSYDLERGIASTVAFWRAHPPSKR
jgi:UDP-glucuronate decarboxylase